jgi:hypothetical protein
MRIRKIAFAPVSAGLLGMVLSATISTRAAAQTTIGINSYRGQFVHSNATSYAVGDFFTRFGLICNATHSVTGPAGSPEVDTTDWQILAQGVQILRGNTSAGLGSLALSIFSRVDDTAYGNGVMGSAGLYGGGSYSTAFGSGAMCNITQASLNVALRSNAASSVGNSSAYIAVCALCGDAWFEERCNANGAYAIEPVQATSPGGRCSGRPSVLYVVHFSDSRTNV